MYLKALATLNENDGWFAKLAAQDLAERDANAAQEAFDILKELALRFPDSRYAPEARRRMHQLVLAQAKHELGVAEYYYVRHAYVAAIQHAQRVVSEFQNTPMQGPRAQQGQDRQGPPLSRALISARKEEAS